MYSYRQGAIKIAKIIINISVSAHAGFSSLSFYFFENWEFRVQSNETRECPIIKFTQDLLEAGLIPLFNSQR